MTLQIQNVQIQTAFAGFLKIGNGAEPVKNGEMDGLAM
jgi:hypothetical protein